MPVDLLRFLTYILTSIAVPLASNQEANIAKKFVHPKGTARWCSNFRAKYDGLEIIFPNPEEKIKKWIWTYIYVCTYKWYILSSRCGGKGYINAAITAVSTFWISKQMQEKFVSVKL